MNKTRKDCSIWTRISLFVSPEVSLVSVCIVTTIQLPAPGLEISGDWEGGREQQDSGRGGTSMGYKAIESISKVTTFRR